MTKRKRRSSQVTIRHLPALATPPPWMAGAMADAEDGEQPDFRPPVPYPPEVDLLIETELMLRGQ